MADIPELPPDINRGPEILATCGSLVGISVVIVMMRMYVRARIVRLVGWDDWCIVAATVSTVSCHLLQCFREKRFAIFSAPLVFNSSHYDFNQPRKLCK